MIFRSVLCVLALASVLSSPASAQSRRRRAESPPAASQPAPAPTDAPPPSPAPEPAAPSRPPSYEDAASASASAPPPAQPAASRPYVDGGLWLTAGSGTRPFLRVEGGFPLSSHLALTLSLAYRPDRVDVPGYLSQEHTLLLIPGLRNEWRLYSGKGVLAAFAEGAAGAGIVRSRVDGFGGQVAGSSWLGVARVGGGVSYVAPFGLSVAVQPLGLAVFFDDHSARARYDFSLLVGYRGR